MSGPELAAGAARVVLLPACGGAIASFTLDAVPVLRPMSADAIANPRVRDTASFPLVPYSNRIRNARLSCGGREHALARNFGDHPHAIHGVGWQREWRVADAAPRRAVLTLSHDARGDSRNAWPWPFVATQTFDLAGNDREAALTLSLSIANDGDEAFPFGLGWHPYFPRDASTSLEFDAAGVWMNDATEIPVERIAAVDRWSFATPRAFGCATIDNVFIGWKGTAMLASHALRTTVTADAACDRLVVFAPAGRDFVAVEPVTHETDAFNRFAAGAVDTGTRMLRPGASFSCTMRLAVRLATRPP